MPDYQKQMIEFIASMKIADHKPACQIIVPRRCGKSLAFRMARSVRAQTQKAMQEKIRNCKVGGTIHILSDQDAQFWSDMAWEEYGRADILFRSGESGNCWKAGKPHDPFAKKTTTPFKPVVTTEDKASEELKKVQRELADMVAEKEQERISDLLYGRTDTAPVTAPAGSPLMKPIDVAPKDGREVMLYCPNESPSHVAAKYVKAYDKDGGGWEGWMYVDPILADIAPEGPQGATHYYELPKPETRIAQFAGGGVISAETMKEAARQVGLGGEFIVPNDRKIDEVFGEEMRGATSNAAGMSGFWRGIPIENFEDDRFTVEQLVEMKHLGEDPKKVPTTIRKIHSVKLNPVSPFNDPNAAVQPIDTSHDVLCPVIQIDHSNNKASIILPDGQVQRVTPIPKLI